MISSSERRFPSNAKDYELFEEIGDGVASTVYRARCTELDEVVAIKIVDLEKWSNDLETIRKEVNILSLIDHPNLLRAHCSFIDGSCLWIVMPYMSGGSCYYIMKSVYPEGLLQSIIATLLREVLKGLLYLHEQGHVHRDVKAGNVLVDSDGTVKLSDFGVCMFDSVERMNTRNTFSGSPCWMAPEVMQQSDGYGFKADIWSFGITALELAYGNAPFSKYPLMKVLLMTLQNAPLCPDYEKDRKFSKSFGELVATCLVKDPKNRPSAANLLKHPFFRHSQSTEYLSCTILDGLSPLSERYGNLKKGKAKLLEGIDDKEKSSQTEYMRGISAWNFNVEDLRKHVTLIPDNELSNWNNSWSREQINIPSTVESSVCNVEAQENADIDLDKLENEEVVNSGIPASPVNCNTALVLLPLLQNLLLQNDIQRERLTGLAQVIGQTNENRDRNVNTEGGQMSRETELESEVHFLKQSIEKLEEEVKRQKTENAQLEEQINRLTRSNDP